MESQTAAKPILNISAYKFVTLDPEWIRSIRMEIRSICRERGLRGTIILSPEGINVFLAGSDEQVNGIWDLLRSYPPFADIEDYKPSYSDSTPFKRMKVKIKQELVPMGHNIDPAKWTAPRVSAKELKQWLDEGRDLVMIDTRNTYETEYGSFDKALLLDIKHFRTFPKFVSELDPELKKKTIVTFCTGGIRCEKAGAFMVEQGFENTYQLDGGILKYFEEVGEDHYRGGCFVFDDRISLDPALNAEFDHESTTAI